MRSAENGSGLIFHLLQTVCFYEYAPPPPPSAPIRLGPRWPLSAPSPCGTPQAQSVLVVRLHDAPSYVHEAALDFQGVLRYMAWPGGACKPERFFLSCSCAVIPTAQRPRLEKGKLHRRAPKAISRRPCLFCICGQGSFGCAGLGTTQCPSLENWSRKSGIHV